MQTLQEKVTKASRVLLYLFDSISLTKLEFGNSIGYCAPYLGSIVRAPVTHLEMLSERNGLQHFLDWGPAAFASYKVMDSPLSRATHCLHDDFHRPKTNQGSKGQDRLSHMQVRQS